MSDQQSNFRFSSEYQLRHTDSFAGTPFVHGGVLLALTEIALADYDKEVGLPVQEEILRMQSGSQIRYRAPIRWNDKAKVSLKCISAINGRLIFEALIESTLHHHVIANFTHRYVYLNTQTGQPQLPEQWQKILELIQNYEYAFSTEESEDSAAR